MKVREQILGILRRLDGGMTAEQICGEGEFSGRTVVSRELKGLIDSGDVTSLRHGRNILYFAVGGGVILDTDLDLWATHEDEIWMDLSDDERLHSNASENAIGAVQFAFTEMLNNAIDHSKTVRGHVTFEIADSKIRFVVRDYGVGAFRKVQREKGLEDEVEAIQMIMKGKTTTMPLAHSGEGIFWVSKLAERFVVSSYSYRLIVDNDVQDYTIEKLDDEVEGTEVWFEIDAKTPASLEEFFGRYIGEREYTELDMTVVQLGLYREKSMWISRSQAKRVLNGLEKYQRVVFDFAGINMVGQAFCDEVFRVFEITHPEIKIEAVNMNDSVKLMVERARRDQLGRHLSDSVVK